MWNPLMTGGYLSRGPVMREEFPWHEVVMILSCSDDCLQICPDFRVEQHFPRQTAHGMRCFWFVLCRDREVQSIISSITYTMMSTNYDSNDACMIIMRMMITILMTLSMKILMIIIIMIIIMMMMMMMMMMMIKIWLMIVLIMTIMMIIFHILVKINK